MITKDELRELIENEAVIWTINVSGEIVPWRLRRFHCFDIRRETFPDLFKSYADAEAFSELFSSWFVPTRLKKMDQLKVCKIIRRQCKNIQPPPDNQIPYDIKEYSRGWVDALATIEVNIKALEQDIRDKR